MRKIDMTGQKFGRLTVIEEAGRTPRKQVLWKCRCDCGNEVVVNGSCLRNGHTTSCGCKTREATIKRNTKHGESDTKLYKIWSSIRKRTVLCNEKSGRMWRDYGSKGIRLCGEWNEYENFAAWAKANGYKDGLSIDRIDPCGDYTPNNCRWATMKQQQNNKGNNVRITYNGETRTLAEWSDAIGINYTTLHYRYQHDYPLEELFTIPKPFKRAVVCIKPDGTEVVYESIAKAERDTGTFGTDISAVCQRKKNRKIANGYGWRYATEEDLAA